MLAKQRQHKIKEMLNKNGAVDVSELVQLFDVSIETVRKDLLYLEKTGFLKRVHGGAVKTGVMTSNDTLQERNIKNVDLKKELSKTAMNFIQDGDFISVDAGSTAVVFAETLKEHFTNLSVVTHSKDVFDILCGHADFNVILSAGHYLKEENAFYGEFVVSTLKKLHVQKAFIFNSAISLKYGVFDFQKDLFEIQKQMLVFADKVYILADSTKFEKTGFLKLCDMVEDYTYITDKSFPKELKKVYLNNGIDIVTGD